MASTLGEPTPHVLHTTLIPMQHGPHCHSMWEQLKEKYNITLKGTGRKIFPHPLAFPTIQKWKVLVHLRVISITCLICDRPLLGVKLMEVEWLKHYWHLPPPLPGWFLPLGLCLHHPLPEMPLPRKVVHQPPKAKSNLIPDFPNLPSSHWIHVTPIAMITKVSS